MLYHVMYSSQASGHMSAADLELILDDARTGNAGRGITGVLVYADGVFLQILEGEESVVRELMASIEGDSRHEAVKVFQGSPIEERAFASWHMAYLAPSEAELAQWMGLEGTATIDQLLDHVRDNEPRLPRVMVSIVEALARA